MLRRHSTIRMFALGGQTAGRRARSRPQLESLEDRLPPNNLSTVGALISEPNQFAAIVRREMPQDQAQRAPASANAQSRQTVPPVLTTVSPFRMIGPRTASWRPVGPAPDQTAGPSTAGANAMGAGLIDVFTINGPSDTPMPVLVQEAAAPGGGGAQAPPAIAIATGGGAVLPSATTPSAAPPAASPSAASTISTAGPGGTGASTVPPVQGKAAAPPTVTPATGTVSGSITGVARQISLGGTTTISPGPAGVPGGSDALVIPKDPGGDAAGGSGNGGPAAGTPLTVASASVAPTNPGLLQSFNGLNSYDQKNANNGNQFYVVPPDQGLAVGNGRVLEVVNDVLQVYDTSGKPLTGVQDLNTFLGYAAQYDYATGQYGPSVTDPSAYFDQPTQRWFVDALTFDVDPTTGNSLGPNHIDIAVSQTADPTGAWNIYRTPVQDDGTQGTPNHGDANYSGPFFGDYPHIGADRNGIYITTNEVQLNSPYLFRAAQVYAFSKAALTSGASSVPVVQFDTIGANLSGYPGFTLIPSLTPGNSYAGAHGGTEYFLSSSAAPLYNSTGSDNVLGLWTMTNTKSLDDPNPSPSLSYSVLNVNTYTLPPLANQKAGDFPLGECLNDPACSKAMFGAVDPYTEVESPVDSIDTRMTQVTYANGKLWGALDTAVNVGGQVQDGIEWFVINPNAGGSGRVDNQGVLALAGNNLIIPAIAVTPSGMGEIGFSVAGNDYYPTAAYATIDANSGVGDIHIAANGAGPLDEFASYQFFGYDRPRFGDFATAVADGNTIWVGNEYIANTGTLAQYMANPTLGGTRTTYTNWDTRLTQVQV